MAGIRRFELTLVIASAAKQSISPRKERKNGLLRFARNDGPDYKRDFAPRGTKRPSRAFISRPPRGRGECRVPDAPAASCALCIGGTHTSNNEYTGSPGIPARNGFNSLCRALPGDRALLPPSSRGYLACPRPVGPTRLPQNLTPASGRQDHTILPSAATSLVGVPVIAHKSFDLPCDPIARKMLPRPSHPVPYVRDDRETPLCVGRDGGSCRGDLGGMKTEIFLQKGLDTPVNKPPDGQITTRQREHIALVSRTRCSVLHAAPQSRDLSQHSQGGPRIQQRTAPQVIARRRRANVLMAL